MLDYTSFANEMYNRAVEKFKDAKVTVEDIMKNNGVIIKTLIIYEKDLNITPTIYLESPYESYKNGKELDDIFSEIVRIFECYSVPESFDTQIFTDYNNAKQGIIFTLVNTEKNKDLLEETPHMDFYDLSIIFSICLRADGDAFAKTVISNKVMEQWGVCVDDLYKEALVNTPALLGFNFSSLPEFLNEMAGEEVIPLDDSSMYIVTNSVRTNGASVILYSDCLKQIAERLQSDLIILPSSIHELMVLKTEDVDDIYRLCDLVKEINETQVSPVDFLSNNIYLYKRETPNKLIIFRKE